MLLCPACGLYVLQEQQHLQYLGLPVQWHQTSTGKPIEQLHSDSPAAAAYVHRGCPFGALQWQQSPALHIMKKAAAVFLTSFCRQHAGLVFWGCDFLLISAPAAVCDSFCRNAALRRMQQQRLLLCCVVVCSVHMQHGHLLGVRCSAPHGHIMGSCSTAVLMLRAVQSSSPSAS